MDDRDPEAERGVGPLNSAEPDDLEADEGFGDEDDYDAPPSVAAAEGPDPAERLRDLVVYMATALVDAPDAVEVDVERRGPHVHLSLRVPEEELGKVIGRQGRIARAMRTALMIAGSRANVRASLDIEG